MEKNRIPHCQERSIHRAQAMDYHEGTTTSNSPGPTRKLGKEPDQGTQSLKHHRNTQTLTSTAGSSSGGGCFQMT